MNDDDEVLLSLPVDALLLLLRNMRLGSLSPEEIAVYVLMQAAANEIERLQGGIDEFLADVDNEHRPEWYSDEDMAAGKDPIWCVTCGAGDGHWPCYTRTALDTLKEIRNG